MDDDSTPVETSAENSSTPQPSNGGYTQAGLARKLGIKRQAITYALAKGKLKLNSIGRIDRDDPLTLAYMEFHASTVKASGRGGTGRPIVIKGARSFSGSAGGSEVGGDMLNANTIIAHNKKLDAVLKQHKIHKAELDYLERAGQLIPLETISRRDSELAAVLEDQFRQFDNRCGDEVCDLCGVSSLEVRMKIKKKIRDEVDYSMRVFKAVLLERMEKLLAPKVA